MEQLLLTMDFIHTSKIIHRDIKLDNILINKIEEDHFVVKIADFGLATFCGLSKQLIFTKCGTPGYAAPEVLRGLGYTYNSDVFSLGAVFFNLLTGCYLFSGQDVNEVVRKNK
jgi:serine/threonine protein kinase